MKKESNPGHKKKWSRPKLIVLVRGDRQEGVLGNCKEIGNPIGPVSDVANCGHAPVDMCIFWCSTNSNS